MNIKELGSHEKYKLNHRVNENGIVERRCTKCLEWREENIDNFYLMNKSKSEKKFTATCKKCSTEAAKKRQLEHRDEMNAYKKKWHRENREKVKTKCKNWIRDHKEYAYNNAKEWRKSDRGKEQMKLAGQKRKSKKHNITNTEWNNCKLYFGNVCAYCGMTEEEHRRLFNQDLHKEHVIEGGRNDLKNCIPSCRSCNSSKHLDTLNQWYNPSNHKFTYERYHKIYLWIRYDCKKYIQAKNKNRKKKSA